MTTILPPCKDARGHPCTKREVGCHAGCEEYKKYQAALREDNKKRYEQGRNDKITITASCRKRLDEYAENRERHQKLNRHH